MWGVFFRQMHTDIRKLNRQNGTGNNSVKGVVAGSVGVNVGCGRRQIDIMLQHQTLFRIASLNVGTMSDRSSEVAETVS